ncbi:MAG: ABC transporter permease [Muribaculaceae bacterium]|nr:ABC transporter permease [Muribaculaceae bacterium]
MTSTGLWASVKRSLHMLCSRRIYIAAMIGVPLFSAFFFLNLLGEGLPLKVPTAIVDMDNSSMSRQVVRSLRATELIDVRDKALSYDEALGKVKSGEVFGFFVIPEDFQKEAVGGRGPTIDFYTNMTYFVPGTLAFKGFKTIAVSTSGALVKTTLVSAGIDDADAGTILQPIVVQDHPTGNPWLNYSIYLSNSFIPGVIALMVMLMTVYSICDEIKHGTSPQWLRTAGGSIAVAVTGKLMPQTVIFSVVGIACQSLLYGYCHFPMHCNAWHMISAMILMVIACQAFALFLISVVPNLRLGLSLTALVGILSFSVTGFSFPVQNMYGSIAIFSYLIPLRYYFLIYIDQALNGIPLYFSRYYYAALLLFPIVASSMLWKLKRHCQHPVYVP